MTKVGTTNKQLINLEATAMQAAQTIQDGFDLYHLHFKMITRRAKSRFENRDWQGAQKDATERLALYKKVILQVVADIRLLLGEESKNQAIWAKMKAHYSTLMAGRHDFQLAATFFNSTTRRIFATVGVNPLIEYVGSDFHTPGSNTFQPVYKSYPIKDTIQEIMIDILSHYQFNVPYQDMERDARLSANFVTAFLQEKWGSTKIYAIEVVKSLFLRNKGAYIIGRISRASRPVPFVVSLLNQEQGVVVDAVLLNENDASIVFSFTRSYFHVEIERPSGLIGFLKSIMPLKPVAELYTSLGYNKHGKTAFYQDFLKHLQKSDDKFELARGARGMVMSVFTLPSYDIVFKIIKDKFDAPKKTTRQHVMNCYQLVFKHDRAGRLADAQEFEHLEFDKERFCEELLAELLQVAPLSVRIEGTRVSISHLYIERRMVPLNLYLREANKNAATQAIIDYGNTIKELAASRIFAGDLLLKNFGVTRHGRVVFYDYDELCLLSDCNFRRIPPPRNEEDEFAAEPWYHVAENDIFPEEFTRFLAIPVDLRAVFYQYHRDLFSVSFWHKMQNQHEAGEIVDLFPYQPNKRLIR